MKKIIIGIIVLAVIAGIGFFLLSPPAVTAAVLYVESGDVQVNTGAGWQAGQDEMTLNQGDQIKTGEGEATVILREGEVVHLQPNSEIKLDQISDKKIKISQVTGETWNKITKISGVSEFTIETPSTVATVRGTEFILNDEQLDVGDGEVDYGPKDNPGKVKVRANKKALKNKMQEEDLTEADFAKLKKFPQKYINALKKQRMREIKRNKALLKLTKRDFNDDDIEKAFNEIDEGRVNEDESYEKAPKIVKPRIKRIYQLTKEIKRAKARQQ